MHGVAADLDAGTQPREVPRLLVDGDVVAGLAQAGGGREPAHAGADDRDVEPFRHASKHSTPPAGRGFKGGVSIAQRGSAIGQLGWKRQPGGMLAGSGRTSPSPTSGTPRPGSGVSTEASSALV